MIDRHKLYDPRRLPVEWRDYVTTYRAEILTIPPQLQPPALVVPSLFAPINYRLIGNINRAHMAATGRFRERFVLVGKLLKQVSGRRRLQGVPTREAGGGYVYVYPQFITGNRAVQLGSGPNRGGAGR